MLRTFAEAAAEYCAGVEKRVGQSLGKMLVLGVLAGAFIAFAGVAASIAGTVGGKLATAAVFPMGLAMVILGGSELFTGNCLFLLPVLGRKCRALDAARCWIAVYLANLVGAVAVALLVTGCGVLDGIAEAAIATAAGKASLSFGTAFLRGILCNFLVCLAVWMAFCAKSAGGKVVSLYGPIFLFVLCGFEHCIANMYYIPAGIFLSGGSQVDWGGFFRNLVPVTLGNMAGGCGLGVILYYLYGEKGR